MHRHRPQRHDLAFKQKADVVAFDGFLEPVTQPPASFGDCQSFHTLIIEYAGKDAMARVKSKSKPAKVTLIRAGASVEAGDKHGFTPLGHAASDGNLEAVEFLLKSGANVNRQSADGSPLHSACAWSHLKIVKVLLAHGANPSALDKDGRTPLYFTKIKPRKIDRTIGKLLKSAISSVPQGQPKIARSFNCG